MEETPRPIPEVILVADGDALVACPCGVVNAVRAGMAFQCLCGWAVLLTETDGCVELEAQSRA